MKMTSEPLSVHARWIVPVSDAPIESGYVSISDGIILNVSDQRPSGNIIDLGDVVLTPGLVNAHTHLEFSDLKHPLGIRDGECAVSFTDWIRLVIEHRINRPLAAENRKQVINQGIQESVDAGVVAMGEIVTSPYDFAYGMVEEIRVVAFLESLGRSTKIIEARMAELEAAIETWSSSRMGLSPHAPYSVHPVLLEQMLRLANDSALPAAIHLAESKEELRLMQSIDGPFASLFQQLDVWEPESYEKNQKPLDWLKKLSEAKNSLVIHGNYLSTEEIEFISHSPNPMTVVYCPRTHAYFGHDRYPLEDFLNKGINVAIGTDSRASNPDLDLLSELKQIALNFPEMSTEKILSFGTLGGAAALGIDNEFGTIEPGKSARLTVIRSKSTHQPFAWLLDDASTGSPLHHSLTD